MMPSKVAISTPSTKELWAHCEQLGEAIDKSDVGQTVTAIQHLILR
jgi:hypothetical protein